MSHFYVLNRMQIESVKLFLNFIAERQRIYVRRFVENRPAPWTKDPVLRKGFFTNVYRELDPGTIYLLQNVVRSPEGFLGGRESEIEELFEILVYRTFNNEGTYEFLRQSGRQHGDFGNWEAIAGLLQDREAQGYRCLTEAHMTCGMRYGGFKDKISNLCWMLHQHWQRRNEIYEEVIGASSIEDQCRRIQKLQGFGPFLAYEVATDMGYSTRLRRFSEDDWANPGPGCVKGIAALFHKNAVPDDLDHQQAMRALRVEQRDLFKIHKVEFPFWRGKELTMRNIEHSLCEFSKYLRGTKGVIRRAFKKGDRS